MGMRRRSGGRGADGSLLDRLSQREREILDGISRGLTNKAIGLELGISHRTVEIYRSRAIRKLAPTFPKDAH